MSVRQSKAILIGVALLAAISQPQGAKASDPCTRVSDDICIVQPGSVTWWVVDNNGAARNGDGTQLGLDTDRPNFVAGEPRAAWANGRDDYFVFRGGVWYGRANLTNTSEGAIETVGNFGLAGDHALIGDFQNSGDQIAVVGRRNSLLYFIVDSNRNMAYDAGVDRQQQWNISFGANDRVLAGYFSDTNGEDLVVFRGDTQAWEFYRQTPIEGVAASPYATILFGSGSALPLVADVNGDGRPDLLRWEPATKRLYINLWEYDQGQGGYAPHFDTDDVRVLNGVAAGANTAALGLNFDNSTPANAQTPLSVTWEDPRPLCPNSGGTIRLRVTALDLNGYYAYLWNRGSCTGNFVGGGYTVVLPAPTSTTTYYVHAEHWGWCTRPSPCLSITIPVSTAPVITENPASITRCPGTGACFSVSATSSGSTASYRWRRDGVPMNNGPSGTGSAVEGATSPTLCLSGVGAGDAGRVYSCVVSNACGQTTSTGATLTLRTATAIQSGPTSQTACAGGTAQFSVNAVGEDLHYSWYRADTWLQDGPTAHGSLISGSGTPTITIQNIRQGDISSRYYCTVYGSCGAISSGYVTLRACPSQDADADGDFDQGDSCPGVSNEGTDFNYNGIDSACDYEEFIRFVPGEGSRISGIFSVSYLNPQGVPRTFDGANDGSYSSGSPIEAAGSGQTGGGLEDEVYVSSGVSLSMSGGWVNASASGSTSVADGCTEVLVSANVQATLRVEITQPAFYRRDQFNGGLTIDPPPATYKRILPGIYTFKIVSSAQGTSGGAFWIVPMDPCPIDLDNDSFVTGTDFDLYVEAFESADIAADVDGDGFVTGIDFDLYVLAFQEGCE